MPGNPTTRAHDGDLGPSYSAQRERHPNAAKGYADGGKVPFINGSKSVPVQPTVKPAPAVPAPTPAKAMTTATATKVDAKEDAALAKKAPAFTDKPVKHGKSSRGFK